VQLGIILIIVNREVEISLTGTRSSTFAIRQ